MNPLRPYKPSPGRPWDRPAAAHLLRRAGFAPREPEVQAALKAGPRATVDRLVDARDESPRFLELDQLGKDIAVRDEIDRLRGWWLLRMCHTRRPLHARMAAFWHNHFATSNTKVNSTALMLQQLRTIERHALGRFEDMLLAISRDPAMIIWLDGEQNVKGRPNENYARELFELFSLGVGHYTEHDIQESARAFTGWHQRGGVFRFVERAHDDGNKEILGQRGRLNGDDVVRIALAQPACGRFIAIKLLREFLCPEPPSGLVEALADHLRQSHYDLASTMRTLLASEAMFDPRWFRARIKSPVELAVGIVRSLEMQVPASELADAVAQMGQRLFEPPSVKGWDGHRSWLNSATMLVRLNIASAAARGQRYDPIALCDKYAANEPAAATDFLINLVLDGRAPDALRRTIHELDGDPAQKLREATVLLLTSPEYQMA